MRSSVHTHLRAAAVDPTDPTQQTTYGSYLYSGLLAALALARLLDDEKPDAMLMINGRMSPTRIALELARQRGIRVVIEERSALPGRVILYDNEYCLGLDGIRRLSRRWREQALTQHEIEAVASVLESRWQGTATEISVFSRGLGHDNIHERLGLESGRPLWVLFTSSMDETADVPHIGSSFQDQEHWITDVVAAVGRQPDLQLVIRVHPNVGSTKSLGQSAGDIAFFEALAHKLPGNVHLVKSSTDISSYALAAAADAGLVWYSTIGLEMAAMGKPVVRAASHWMEPCDFIPQLHAGDPVVEMVSAHISRTAKDGGRALAVAAWRYAHLWFLRQSIPFRFVRQPNWYAGELAWSSVDELAPGRDAELDRICDVIISARPLHDDGPPPPPSAPDAEAGLVWARLSRALGGSAGLG